MGLSSRDQNDVGGAKACVFLLPGAAVAPWFHRSNLAILEVLLGVPVRQCHAISGKLQD